MMNKLFTTAAAGAMLIGATTAYAQQTTAPDTQTPTVTDGTTIDNNTAVTTDSAASSSSYITAQAADQISANTYIGQTVYNAGDENVGDINDLILEKNGGIVAAVVGVGGFLGIGEKYVAVPITNISVTQNADGGQMKLTTTETAESLKAAPEFKTLAMQSAARNDATGVTPTDSTTTSSTTAPVDPMAKPADPSATSTTPSTTTP